MTDCPFCSEFRYKNFDHSLRLKDYFLDSRIITGNTSLCIFPTVGCFVKGYVLLSTIDHYSSLYNCPDKVLSEVEEAIAVLKNTFYRRLNSGLIFFEHGTVKDYDLSSASVCHFHMHFLPTHGPIWDVIRLKYGLECMSIPTIMDIKNFINKHNISSYLLFGDYDSKIYLIDCTRKNYPSQFFRQVMYEYYYGSAHNNEWNWRIFPYYEFMVDTADALKDMEL